MARGLFPLGWLRATWFGVFAFFWTLLAFVVGVLMLLPDLKKRRGGTWLGLGWSAGLLLSQGITWRIEGKEHLDPKSPRMLVANHTSYLDPPVMMLLLARGHARFVLKRELIRLPFVGWYAALAGNFLINRASPREGKVLMDRIVARIKRYDYSPIVFPEGTRSLTNQLGPLRAGAFDLAVRAGIPIQPVWIEGAFERMPKGAAYPRFGGRITAHVGPAITVEGLRGGPGRKIAARRAEDALLALQAKVRGDAAR